MMELTVYNRSGQEVEKVNVDETVLGGAVRYALLKQAIVMYHANQRVGTAATKSRGMVAGSTKKLYRQKGTGNARMGNRRTGIRTGGGVIFAKIINVFLPPQHKFNPCIGAAGVSAVPMASRVVQDLVSKESEGKVNPLMAAMGPNVAGVIGSAVAAGVFLALLR